MPRRCSFIQQLDFHRSRRGRRRGFECLLSLLQTEAVCNQRFQVNESLGNERDGFRIGLHIPELEANIDLAERCVQPRPLLEVFAADADDEDRPAET